MQRTYAWAQVAILAGTGLYLTVTLAQGAITNYIAARFVWLAWGAAALLLIMAAVRVAALRNSAEHTHDHDHPHRLGLAAWAGLGIAALPALLGFLVPSAPLDGRAIDRPISRDLGSLHVAAGHALALAPEQRTVLDWLSAFNTSLDPAEFDGQRADVIGFVHREPSLTAPDQFMLARFVISCCVADAQAIALTVEWFGGATLHEDAWVRVRGVFDVRDADGVTAPVLVADPGSEGVTPIDRPDHPYLYP
jgi:putative membrane protein